MVSQNSSPHPLTKLSSIIQTIPFISEKHTRTSKKVHGRSLLLSELQRAAVTPLRRLHRALVQETEALDAIVDDVLRNRKVGHDVPDDEKATVENAAQRFASLYVEGVSASEIKFASIHSQLVNDSMSSYISLLNRGIPQPFSSLPSSFPSLILKLLSYVAQSPFDSGAHLATLQQLELDAIIPKNPVKDAEPGMEIILRFIVSAAGPTGLLSFLEGFTVAIFESITGIKSLLIENSLEGAPVALVDPTRSRELEETLVRLLLLVGSFNLMVDDDSLDSESVNPFEFGKGFELCLLEVIAEAQKNETVKANPSSSHRHVHSPSLASTVAPHSIRSGDYPWSKSFKIPSHPPSPFHESAPTSHLAPQLGADSTQLKISPPIPSTPLGPSFDSSPAYNGSSYCPPPVPSPFQARATKIIETLSAPSSISGKTPLLLQLCHHLLQNHFPANFKATAHRRVILILVIRWYSAKVLRQAMIRGHLIQPKQAASLSLNSSDMFTPTRLMDEVWLGSSSENVTKLEEVFKTVYNAMVKHAGFTVHSLVADLPRDDHIRTGELERAAARLVNIFVGSRPSGETRTAASVSSRPPPSRAFSLSSSGIHTIISTFKAIFPLLTKSSPTVNRRPQLLHFHSNSSNNFKVGAGFILKEPFQLPHQKVQHSICTEKELEDVQFAMLEECDLRASLLLYTGNTASLSQLSYTPPSALDLTANERALANNQTLNLSSSMGSVSSNLSWGDASSPKEKSLAAGDYFSTSITTVDDGLSVSDAEKERIHSALLSLIRAGYIPTSNIQPPDILTTLKRAAIESKTNLDFSLALLFSQAVATLHQIKNKTPELATNNFASLISSIARPAVEAEAAKLRHIASMEMKLQEIQLLVDGVVDEARSLRSMINDERVRAYSSYFRSAPEMDLLRAEVEVSCNLDERQENDVREWVVHQKGICFELASPGQQANFHYRCRALDTAIVALSDPHSILYSCFWKTEYDLCRPYLKEQDHPISLEKSTTVICLPFGGCHLSLLKHGESTSLTLAAIESFLLRTKLKITAYIIGQNHLSLQEGWFETVARGTLSSSSTSSSSTDDDLVAKEWVRSILKRFTLHPSPYQKLRSLFSLELLLVSALSAPQSSLRPHERRSSASHTPRHRKIHSSRAHHQNQETGKESVSGYGIPEVLKTISFGFASYVLGGSKVVAPSSPSSRKSRSQPPNTDIIVQALEDILLDGSMRPRHLFEHLQLVACFVPGEILDFKDEGKAFLDVSLAALTVRSDLLSRLLTEGLAITRNPSSSREQKERAVYLLHICASEGMIDEAQEELRKPVED